MPPFSSSAGNVLPLFDRNSADIDSNLAGSERMLYLNSLLQSSLDVEDVLSLFSEEMNAYVPHDAMHYSLESRNGTIGFKFATRDHQYRHRLGYNLSVNKEDLGVLQISRKRKFTVAEIHEVEDLIRALLYPLRNALLYRTAVFAAHKDSLTGVCNRAAFDEVLSRETEISLRHGRSLGMIILDIDHFKKINDTYGHATGDCLLKTLTRCAQNTIRLSDQLFRYGGEEFVILAPETSIEGIRRLAERIRRNLQDVECICEDKRVRITASFGVAILKQNENEESFFDRANKALYQAKADGRNCTRVAE